MACQSKLVNLPRRSTDPTRPHDHEHTAEPRPLPSERCGTRSRRGADRPPTEREIQRRGGDRDDKRGSRHKDGCAREWDREKAGGGDATTHGAGRDLGSGGRGDVGDGRPGGGMGRRPLRREGARLRAGPSRGEGPAPVRADESAGRAGLDRRRPRLVRMHRRPGERLDGRAGRLGDRRGRDGHPQLHRQEGDHPHRGRPDGERPPGGGPAGGLLDDPQRHRPEPRHDRLRRGRPGAGQAPRPDDRPDRPGDLEGPQDGLGQPGDRRLAPGDRPDAEPGQLHPVGLAEARCPRGARPRRDPAHHQRPRDPEHPHPGDRADPGRPVGLAERPGDGQRGVERRRAGPVPRPRLQAVPDPPGRRRRATASRSPRPTRRASPCTS